MNQAIKKKIEEIKSGKVPSGYKKTQIGIFPVEWEEKRIGEVLSERKTLMCVSKDAPLLSFTIEEGIIEPEDKKSNKRDFLIKDIKTKKFALTEIGDIIYNPANLKFGAIHRNNLRKGVVSPIYKIFYGNQNSDFLGFFFHSQRFIDYSKIYTEGTVEKLKTLNADTFLKLRIIIPSLLEQKRIVDILKLQDRVIELKEKLLKEKQKEKKYLMQQLLTGKIRLKGFTDGWKATKLKDISKIFAGGTPDTNKKEYWDGNINWICSGEVQDCILHKEVVKRKISIKGLQNSSAKIIKKGSVVLAMTGATCGKTGFLTFETSANQSVMAFEPFACEAKFLYYLLQTNKSYILSFQAGGAQSGINKYACENMILKFPTLKEQKVIEDTISTKDKEIELIKQEIDNEKQKKKALMQLLLSGIVRVG